MALTTQRLNKLHFGLGALSTQIRQTQQFTNPQQFDRDIIDARLDEAELQLQKLRIELDSIGREQATAPKVGVSFEEEAMIDRLMALGYRVDRTERRSERAFDLNVSGVTTSRNRYISQETRFSAWLPLFAIRELVDWCADEVAIMSDYPAMVREGDWSGIRDSEDATVWAIFEQHVLCMRAGR